MRLLRLPLWVGGGGLRRAAGEPRRRFSDLAASLDVTSTKHQFSKMALVAYSDSEGSDTEAPPPPTLSKSSAIKNSNGPGFQKVEPRKIKVDLPTVLPQPSNERNEEPPAKRTKTTGAFSGFNSLLPAPKKAAQSGPRPGVSLKTSSEAAFSRSPVEAVDQVGEERTDDGVDGVKSAPAVQKEEPKIVGKATKFKPLSVGNKKKTAKKSKLVDENDNRVVDEVTSRHTAPTRQEERGKEAEAPPPPKPKRSLFSVPQAEETTPAPPATGVYESLTTESQADEKQNPTLAQAEQTPDPALATNPNSLHSLTSDLNLTPAQRRQIFGRHGKGGDVNITHFNMDNEYAANEQLRQAGEVVEHRAVKSIAPGKHSLQQLVNNARSQREGLEDKWAEGRRERGEAGRGYGWGR